MKNVFLKKVLLALIVLFSVQIFAQSGSNCSNAVIMTNANDTLTDQFANDTVYWYRFTANSAGTPFFVVNDPGYQKFVTGARIYSGSCGSLTEMEAYSFPGSGGSLTIIGNDQTIGTDYYLKLIIGGGGQACRTCPDGALFDIQIRGNHNYAALPAVFTLNCQEVGNGGFDQNAGLANATPGQIALSNGWFTPTTGTPDYFSGVGNYGAPTNIVCVPPNVGTIPANSGATYMGFGCHSHLSNSREYVGANLCEMYAGETYTLSFFYQLPPGVRNAVDQLSVLFYSGPAVIQANNQVLVAPGGSQRIDFNGTPLSAGTWTQLTTSFTATANHTRMCIGNMNNDANTTLTLVNPGVVYDSYYLIEDVSVIRTIPDIALTATSTNVCFNTPVTLTLSGTNPNDTYTWTNGTTTFTATAANPNYTYTATTTQTWTVSSNSTCCPQQTSITITVNNPQITLSGAPNPICQGASSTLTASGVATYTWTPTGQNGSTITVSPASTTVYTVTGTDGNGCNASATYTLTVLPNPTVTIANNNQVYCSNVVPPSVTFTASGAGTYLWNTGATTAALNISPTPTASATYTVTGTSVNGCTATATASLTINAAPVITIPVTTICVGTFATLTASGALTYTWTPPAGNTNANPHTTGIYTTTGLFTNVTVTGTAANGCTSTATATINVVTSPTVTASYATGGCGSPGALCPGTSVVLTATSSTATGFTWNPGGLSGSPIIVAPTSTTIYTVTAANGSCPSSPATVVIPVGGSCNCTGPALPAATAGTVTVGAAPPRSLNANFTIPAGGTYIMNGTTLKIAPNISITVSTGATLTITGSAHLSACNGMWQGIIVQPGGTVNVNGGSLIEHAIIALDNGGSGGVVNAGQPSRFFVNNAIFNCNRTAILQSNYQSSNNANYNTSAFSINNTVITCRCGISKATPIATLNQYTGGGTVANPTINDYYSVANLTSSTLKSPYPTDPAFEGVHLENNGPTTNVQTASPVPYVHNVGGGGLVLFDNLAYGINATNASFNVSNSAFQLGRNYPSFIFGNYGINAVNTNKDRYNGIYVNNSRFLQLRRDINNINYFDIDINTSTFFSRQIAPTIGGFVVIPNNGDYGMFIKTPRFLKANMNQNNMANLRNAIHFIIDATATYNGGNGEYVGPVQINNNTIRDQFPTTSLVTAYVSNAIIADNVLTAPGTGPVAGGGTQIQIQNNTIFRAYRGILARNQYYQTVRDEQNTITLLAEPNGFFGLVTTQYGIQHHSDAYFLSTNNYGNDIYKNTVTGFTTTFTNPSAFEKKKGIWSRFNGNHYVTCNTVSNAGRGFEFEGLNNFMFWQLNQMNSNGEAFALTNSAIIGQQGSASGAIDNSWSGSGFADTYTDANSNPVLSNLYVQNSTLPLGPVTNISPLGTPYNYGVTVFAANPASSYSCSIVPPTILINNGGSISNAKIFQNNTALSSLSLAEQIVLDSVAYLNYVNENAYLNKFNVYRSLRGNPSLMSGSVILQSFYTLYNNSNMEKFCVTEDSLRRLNFAYSSVLLNTVNPINVIEQNYKNFYQLYAKGMSGTFAPVDSALLESIAEKCPMLHGEVVFQARSFHNSLYNSFKHYEDNCPMPVSGGSSAKTEAFEHSIVNSENSMTVYPNPTNGMFFINFSNGESTNYTLEVYSLSGALVYKHQLIANSGKSEALINADNGMYFVRVYDQNGTLYGITRISINK